MRRSQCGCTHHACQDKFGVSDSKSDIDIEFLSHQLFNQPVGQPDTGAETDVRQFGDVAVSQSGRARRWGEGGINASKYSYRLSSSKQPYIVSSSVVIHLLNVPWTLSYCAENEIVNTCR